MSRWAFRFRESVPIIPGLLRLNLSSGGASWTWHLGRFVSWNSRTHNVSINTPGPGGVVRRGRRRRSN